MLSVASQSSHKLAITTNAGHGYNSIHKHILRGAPFSTVHLYIQTYSGSIILLSKSERLDVHSGWLPLLGFIHAYAFSWRLQLWKGIKTSSLDRREAGKRGESFCIEWISRERRGDSFVYFLVCFVVASF